jgi:hypothetical protein
MAGMRRFNHEDTKENSWRLRILVVKIIVREMIITKGLKRDFLLVFDPVLHKICKYANYLLSEKKKAGLTLYGKKLILKESTKSIIDEL